MSFRNFASRLFISQPEQRLRAGWRVSIQTILLLLVSFILIVPARLALLFIPANTSITLLLLEIVSLAAITISVFLARRYLDRRTFTSLGFQTGSRVWRDLLAGFLIAGVTLLLVYLFEFSASYLRLTSIAWQDTSPIEIILGLGIMLAAFVATGWQEELYFRGYLLQNLADGLNLGWGVLLSSVIFGLAHLSNPNASWMGALGVGVAGLFMAFAYYRTRQLWLPIGLHIGWNFFEGPLLGFPVSGIGTFQLLHNQIDGPILLTGGSFGPEAGLVLLPALLVGTALVYIYSKITQ